MPTGTLLLQASQLLRKRLRKHFLSQTLPANLLPGFVMVSKSVLVLRCHGEIQPLPLLETNALLAIEGDNIKPSLHAG